MRPNKTIAICLATSLCALLVCVMAGCVSAGQESAKQGDSAPAPATRLVVSDVPSTDPATTPAVPATTPVTEAATTASATGSAEELRARLDLVEDLRPSLYHGPKPAAYQRYIVMHDTEGGGEPESVVDYWDSNGNLVGAHFVVGKDGHIVQCIPLDTITHHAGYGDTGHNEKYGITEDGRDDMAGTTPIGSWASDYGMNAWSVGIEMIHNGATDSDYPEAQLAAVDGLIAYIDAYFGNKSEIIDHNDWRTGNSDCSPEFQQYLVNYQDHRSHN